jgi:hypothetical protein
VHVVHAGAANMLSGVWQVHAAPRHLAVPAAQAAAVREVWRRVSLLRHQGTHPERKRDSGSRTNVKVCTFASRLRDDTTSAASTTIGAVSLFQAMMLAITARRW